MPLNGQSWLAATADTALPNILPTPGKSSPMPHGGVRILEDYRLSRYACYLIVMNGDPRKEVIAVGQTYFAVKTRQQELIDHYDELSEDQKRLAIRKEMKAHNKSLAEAAQKGWRYQVL